MKAVDEHFHVVLSVFLLTFLQHVIWDSSQNAPTHQYVKRKASSQASYFSQHAVKSNYCVKLFLRNNIFLSQTKTKRLNSADISSQKEEALLIGKGKARRP